MSVYWVIARYNCLSFCFLVHWVNYFDKQCKCTTFLRGIMQPFLLKLCKTFLLQSAVFYWYKCLSIVLTDSSSSRSLKMACSLFETKSSRYWYLNFFRARHSRALWRLLSSFTFTSTLFPRRPGLPLPLRLCGRSDVNFFISWKTVRLKLHVFLLQPTQNFTNFSIYNTVHIFFLKKYLQRHVMYVSNPK